MADEKDVAFTGLQLNTQWLKSTNDHMNGIKAVFMRETYAVNVKLYHMYGVFGGKHTV